MSNEKLIAALPLAALFAAVVMHTPTASAQEGMVVSRDPQTGQLRTPTANEMQALTKQQRTLAPAAKAQPKAVSRSDGVRQVYMGESSQVYTVVARDANGKLVKRCVQGESAAKAALDQPAAITEEHDHEDR
jgi:hypothetical protein